MVVRWGDANHFNLPILLLDLLRVTPTNDLSYTWLGIPLHVVEYLLNISRRLLALKGRIVEPWVQGKVSGYH